MNRRLCIALLTIGGLIGSGASGSPEPTTKSAQLEPYVEAIEGTLVTFEMVPVPAGTVAAAIVEQDPPADTTAAPPAGQASAEIEVEAFWIGRTEVTWDAYDVWMLGLDVPSAERRGIDAESRPSRPYGAPDRGFGHVGYAAISVTHHAAVEFTRWLSGKTGRVYRLPTFAEWRHACRTGIGERRVEADYLDESAWYAANAGRSTHPVGSKQPDRLGLFDMLGNAGEWALDPNGDAALLGGAYRDDADGVGCDVRAPQTRAWNATDPQVPKSAWWLSDGPFAGFRVVRQADDAVYLGAGMGENPLTASATPAPNAIPEKAK